MQFLVQFGDVLALFLVFFGLVFFLFRRFFMWYLATQTLIDGQERMEAHLELFGERLERFEARFDDWVLQNATLDLSSAQRLKKVAEETLNPPLAPADPFESDFRPVNPKVKKEVLRRSSLNLCLYCGESAPKGQRFCTQDHEAKFRQGNQVLPINLPFEPTDEA
ncbi:MAG: hypothetical protein A2600_04425 [Candidatus Lambdaproteobacteria bacterium RIFOXYD1_FULL_56_27]|nr:MAG: hypothetical protein A2600_04425 [Candidatus Lambdaproteobacteria bacterium RIFOXYD1_FULL_56_27]